MASQACSRILRCILAIMLAFGVVVAPATAFPNPAAFDAEAALAARHAVLGLETATDSHVHEDGKPEERRIGHEHRDGHADHSHEKAGILVVTGTNLISKPQVWSSTPRPVRAAGAGLDLDRPPRRAS